MLAESASTTMQQEGYGVSFHVKEVLRDGESPTDTIVKYAEHASMAKSKFSELEVLLSMLEMCRNTAQPPPGYMPQQHIQAAYFTPAAPTFQAPMPPTTIAFQNPCQQGSAQRQRRSGGNRGSNAGKRRKKRVHDRIQDSLWNKSCVLLD